MNINSASLSLPPQMIPFRRKTEKWKKDCMDSLEAIGRHQFYNNLSLVENYEMVRGKFIYSHYIEREDYGELVDQLTREFEMPSHLRHYDIISQVINTLSGEYQKRPDIFRVKAQDENNDNLFLKQKAELLMEYIMEQLNTTISQKLLKEGLDVNKSDFESPEEQEQYQAEVQKRAQALTPPEIEKYMNTKWMSAAEQWAEHQIEADKQRFNLPEKEKIEFEDMLVADRCFRHFFLTPNDYDQETWNPINTFYHKSPEVTNIENGDYVGRVFYLTISDIISRYGHMMTEDQLLSLEKAKKESYDSGAGEHWSGLKPNTVIPYQDYAEARFTKGALGFDPNNPETVEGNILTALGEDKGNTFNRYNLFQVTEGYWMSQRKIGKYVYPDETGRPTTVIVDEETFNPKMLGAEVIENSFQELGNDERINTVTWTWVNQVWKGIKINNTFTSIKEPVYINVAPSEFQFKGDLNIYGARLPVCGQVFNNRNADSMSLVDLMKPHQIGYNVAMNQLYEIMQREIGRFMLMDFNFIPSGADWGGERNYEKLMLIAKQLGIAPVDGSPANTKQSNFAHFQEIDLDESARMLSRLKIAEAFETFALKQVGITPQRLGSTTASESATGVQQAVNQSYAQTESYFTNFSNYKRRCLQMNLEISQFVQAKKDTVMFTYTKSDLSRGWVKTAGTDLLLSEFGIFISNSQELARQLEMLRQLALENNTSGASVVDLATIITSNSPSEIKTQLETTYKNLKEQEQQQFEQQQQIEQQKIEAAQKMAQEQREYDAEQKELDRQNLLEVAKVRGMGFAKNTDTDANGIPDILEHRKFEHQAAMHADDVNLKREQENNKRALEEKKLKMNEEDRKLQEKQMAQQDKQAEEDRKLKREEMRSKEKIAAKRPKPKS